MREKCGFLVAKTWRMVVHSASGSGVPSLSYSSLLTSWQGPLFVYSNVLEATLCQFHPFVLRKPGRLFCVLGIPELPCKKSSYHNREVSSEEGGRGPKITVSGRERDRDRETETERRESLFRRGPISSWSTN